jgi:hypothetical protein
VVAPHLIYPTHNGADIHISRKWAEFSRYEGRVDILGANSVKSYEDGKLVNQTSFKNKIRSRSLAALRSIIFNAHYLKEKFNTKAFKTKLRDQTEKYNYDLIICSFISSADMVVATFKNSNVQIFIETHNNELKWFLDLRITTKNIVVKLICKLSENWLRRFLTKNYGTFRLINVSLEDDVFYRDTFQLDNTIISPGGCDIEDHVMTEPAPEVRIHGIPRLLFVGSLSATMNYDALVNFSKNYAPVLASRNILYQLRVVGSNPTPQVISLCHSMNWTLFRDVNEEELANNYKWADYSILPFSYSNGNKLKLYSTLARGVPFLASSQVVLHEFTMDKCLSSNDANLWVDMLSLDFIESHTNADFSRLKEVALKYSWTYLAEELAQKI